jgi:protein involved in polysaccharide export with SLBB domain
LILGAVQFDMKTPLILAFSFLASFAWSQDAGYKREEPRRQTVQPSATPLSDDSGASAAKINSMEVLDDSRALQIGDRISLRVVEDRDKVQSLVIQDSGDIQAPHVGLVKAVGKTCKQVAYSMKKELEKSYFQQATVIIALEQIYRKTPGNGPGIQDTFVVYGQVQRQGKYELSSDEDLTVSQAILRAGGFAQFANTKTVKLIRKTPKGSVTILLNLDDVMNKGRLEKDIPMRANDVIIVKEKKFNI